MKRLLDGALLGAGFVAVVAVAFAIAWAGDVFTVDKDGAPKFAVSDQGKITVGATESYVNLVIQNNAGASTNKVDITADVLTVEGVRLEGLNVSADVTAAVGAGGRDTNFADAADTWYYVWVITNNTGASTNGLLSTSSTSPTLPSGFTRKRRVGAVRNDGSSNFLQFVQEGNSVCYLDGYVNNLALTAGQATSWTTVTASAYIAPTSRRGSFAIWSQVTHNVAGVWFSVLVRRTGFSGTQSQVRCPLLTSVANQEQKSEIDVMTDVNENQQIDYKISTVPSSSGGAYICVIGYYDRI